MAESEAPRDEQPVFDLCLFRTLSNAQSAHGIPLQDYKQYHAYCTKKLHRIRHHRDVRPKLVHSFKYGKSVSAEEGVKGKKGKSATGGRHAFCPRPAIPDDGYVAHEYFLWNLVFQAERSWAQACTLQASTQAGNSKTKSQILSRLKKAVHWAKTLDNVVKEINCVTEISTKEIGSYLAWLQGNERLQKKEYAEAFRFYNSSRTILLELANSASTEETEQTQSSSDAELLARKDMFNNRADNLLLPLVRYCQYEAKDEDLVADEGLSSKSTTNKESNGMTLEFCSEQIPLDAYPQLAVLYLKLEKRLADEDGSKMTETDFLQFLADLDDAMRWTIEESHRYDNLQEGPAIKAKRRELASLKAFFQYHKLSLQRQHQEERLFTENTFTSDAAEMLHVYDSLLQNAQLMVELNNLDDPTEDADYNPEDDPNWLEAQAHVIRLRAIRCFHMARVYESPKYLSGTTSGQALALYQQCRVLQRRAEEEVAACDFPEREEEIFQNQLNNLKVHILSNMARVKASRFLEQQEERQGSSKATNRPLWLRINELDGGTVLADQDPSPLAVPIPCKPVFYDVACELATDNSASLDALEDFIAQNEPKKKKIGGGLFSWF